MADVTLIRFSQICQDGGTQSRAALDGTTIDAYAVAMRDGAVFPPVTVFYDGTTYWLADGFHRLLAMAQNMVTDIPCDVRQGSKRDAILFSVGANALHGLRRSNIDKRIAVETLLRDEEWSTKSDVWISERCGVSHTFVARVRAAAQPATVASPIARVGKDGRARALPSKKKEPAPVPMKSVEPVTVQPEMELELALDEPTETSAEQTARRHRVLRESGIDPEEHDRTNAEWDRRRLVAMAERNDAALGRGEELDDLVLRRFLHAYVHHLSGPALVNLYDIIAHSLLASEEERKRQEKKAAEEKAKAERKAARASRG